VAACLWRPADDQPVFHSAHKTGIAGAPLLAGEDALHRIAPGSRVFFGYDRDIARRFGLPNGGTAEYLRRGRYDPPPPGLFDLGSLKTGDSEEALVQIGLCAAHLRRQGAVPILVACDHTASLAAVMGVADDLKARPIYVYLDAHLDLGRICHPDDLLHNGGFVARLLQEGTVAQALNIGGRSLMSRHLYDPVPGFGLLPVAPHDWGQALAPLRGKAVYVSIDADVLDPGILPQVPCPEPQGLSGEGLLGCCRWLAANCRVLGADLSELMPTPEVGAAPRLLVDCLLALTAPAGADV
jgi:agmatinase